MTVKRWGSAIGGIVLLGSSACAGDVAADGEADLENDSFLEAGKADAFGIEDGSPEACNLLKLASSASESVLRVEARLDRRAVSNLMAFRAGEDGAEGTEDDGWLASLQDLDDVKWIGPATFNKLVRFSRARPEFACGVVDVQLLATNDFHGNLKPPSGSSGRIVTGPDPNVNRVDVGGAEFLATHVERLRATNPNTLMVAAGDVIGATPLISALFHDEPTIESMNLMGLAVAAVGNHEFDEGADELLRMQHGGCHPIDGCLDGDDFEGARFRYLAANVLPEGSNETLLPPYTVRRFGRARIAFIGLTLEGTPLVTTAAGVEGLRFLDESDTINALVPEIRAQGIESIVVLIHEGGAATGLYNTCTGISGPLFEIVGRLDSSIDVVVAGHTNAAHVCEVNGMLVTSAASFGRLVTDIDLSIDELTGEVTTRRAENVLVTRDVAPDAAQTALIAKYDRLAAPFANRVVGSISGDLTKLQNAAGESTMGDVIADAQLAATSAQDRGGAQMAFMNPGGVRTDILAAQVSGGEAAGEATYGEAFAVQPFGNNLVVLTVTGAQILTMLEQQWSVSPAGAEKANILAVSRGFSYTWDPARPIGMRVDPSSVRLDGAPIDPAASYRITVNSFLADGGDGFSVLRAGTDRRPGPIDVDALTDYLTAQSPLVAPATDRITRVAPPTPPMP